MFYGQMIYVCQMFSDINGCLLLCIKDEKEHPDWNYQQLETSDSLRLNEISLAGVIYTFVVVKKNPTTL